MDWSAERVREYVSRVGQRRAERDLGLARHTLRRIVRGETVLPSTLARIKRGADAYPQRPHLGAPRVRAPSVDWPLERVRSARAAQLRGDFAEPVRLAEVMRTDDALFVAYTNRCAPIQVLGSHLEPASGTGRAREAAARAGEQCSVPLTVLAGLQGTLCNHGIAIGYLDREYAADGSEVRLSLSEWPLEAVKWDPSAEILTTRLRDAMPVPITHGDGQWVVLRKHGLHPWTQDACVLPAALVWAGHAHGVIDWAGASRSHGLARIIGELPEGFAIRDGAGNLTPEAQDFIDMLQDVVAGESGAGIRPAGSKTDFVSNSSSAWQVFAELLANRERAAARIYLGTDGTLGSVGGAPGVDIAALFGVATTKIQGDLEAISRALYVGVYQPWAALTYGDSRLAPRLVHHLPDPDEHRHVTELAERERLFVEAVQRYQDAGFSITQEVVDTIAARYRVAPPDLAAADDAVVPLDLAPTDVAVVVRGREARASRKLPPFGDERDDMTIAQLRAAAQGDAQAAVAEATAEAQASAEPAA